MSSEPRKVTGGASLLINWRLVGKTLLVVGGGKEASGRVFFALDADAKVTLVAPLDGLSADVRQRISRKELTHVDREFLDSDIVNPDGTLVDMVLSCIDDHVESRRIAILCRDRRIPVNCADIPDLCDFYFMAQYRDQDLQIGVSTNGCGPRLGARLRTHIVNSLPARTGDAVARVGALRKKIRIKDPSMTEEAVMRRMKWLSALCDKWSFDELAELDDVGVLELLDAYEKGEKVPPAIGQRKSTQQVMAPRASSISRSIPLVGYVLGPIASVTTAAFGMAHDCTRACIDITSSTMHAIKTTSEDVIETSLNFLPNPISNPLRATLSYLPLPLHIKHKKGRILLVGAGPGDPNLLTLAALHALKNSDLVVSDQLVPPRIQKLVPRSRLILAQRKEKGQSDNSQTDTNEICLRALKQGKVVTRLKSGDPFLFGRGGEEVLFFKSHDFAAEIVPGISSCIAAPASVNIPVTHRGVSDHLLVLSGRGEGGALPSIPQYNPKRTTVILMAVARLSVLVQLMADVGYPETEMAAVVEKGCWGNGEERVVRGTLRDICEIVKEAEVGSPALLIVGGVIGALEGM